MVSFLSEKKIICHICRNKVAFDKVMTKIFGPKIAANIQGKKLTDITPKVRTSKKLRLTE